ncbi:MAG TPA: hypothetical protein VHF25_14505 [Nitriliruptorales bacterium]|nr:hypothetical protein [Nitriliruptorales bacterium]
MGRRLGRAAPRWRARDIKLSSAFWIGAGLGILGIIGTLPPFFEAVE